MDSSFSLDITEVFTKFSILILAFVLVLLNSFFVAAEFSMVKLRSTRVKEIAKKSGYRGRILRIVHTHLDVYLSACQLGITLASLGLGWIGEPAFAQLLKPIFEISGIHSPELLHAISFFIAFFLTSYLHIVVGELAPKSWAIRKPELLSLWTAVPLYFFYWLMYPAIYLLNASANKILAFAGQGPSSTTNHENEYSREELKLILHSSPGQNLNSLLTSAVEMGDLDVLDWANAREDLVAIDSSFSLTQILAKFRQYEFSRYPVYDRKSNSFIGLLHIKDLLLQLANPQFVRENFSLSKLTRRIETISRHMPLARLLEKFRKEGSHFALVKEADGKVVGYLTMEDVLEVLVGDIQDEHRKTERGILSSQSGKLLLVRGGTPLLKIERLLQIKLDHIESETVAGLIYDTLKRVPTEGEILEVEGLRMIIKRMKGPKISLAEVLRAVPNG